MHFVAPKERYAPAMVLFKSNAVIFGGRTRFSAVLNDTHIIDLNAPGKSTRNINI